MANSVATKKPLINTRRNAAPLRSSCSWLIRVLRARSLKAPLKKRVEFGIPFQTVEHRVRGQPALHLGTVLGNRLDQMLERLGLLSPERIERREVVVQEEVVAAQLRGALVRTLGLGV